MGGRLRDFSPLLKLSKDDYFKKFEKVFSKMFESVFSRITPTGNIKWLDLE